MADIQNRCTSRVRSAFDEHCLNLPQFVQLLETFVGQDIPLPTVKSLIEFIKEEYKQTEESKIEQLEKVNIDLLVPSPNKIKNQTSKQLKAITKSAFNLLLAELFTCSLAFCISSRDVLPLCFDMDSPSLALSSSSADRLIL